VLLHKVSDLLVAVLQCSVDCARRGEAGGRGGGGLTVNIALASLFPGRYLYCVFHFVRDIQLYYEPTDTPAHVATYGPTSPVFPPCAIHPAPPSSFCPSIWVAGVLILFLACNAHRLLYAHFIFYGLLIGCRTSVPEDLGQIEHIFTDKTGTLTENNMVCLQMDESCCWWWRYACKWMSEAWEAGKCSHTISYFIVVWDKR